MAPKEPEMCHTVLRSDITRTMLPGPAISTSFSCQLSSTLMAWPLPSPPPTREWIWEKPVDCGDRTFEEEAEDGCEVWAMPLYLCRVGILKLISVLNRCKKSGGVGSNGGVAQLRGKRSQSKRLHIQIFHQGVENFHSSFRTIYSVQHRRHIRLLRGLQYLDHNCEMNFLPHFLH